VRLGIDIGGAFTDLVAVNENGSFIWVKVETTSEDPARGVMRSLEESGISADQVSVVIHGQTIGINTIVERKGAKVGLLTTKGFRDVLEIGRANRRDMYNFNYRKPEPLVPRRLRLELSERTTASGEIVTHLDPKEVEEAANYLLSHGVESIAVAFINSYINPSHEIKVGEILEGLNVKFFTLSHNISMEWREYERTSTAVVNAYIQPNMGRYLSNLEEQMRQIGFRGSLLIMTSSSGVTNLNLAKSYPVLTLESGPAAGVIAATTVAEAVGVRNIIALDGGSTTTKASLVRDLSPKVITDYYVNRDKFHAGIPVKIPTVDIVEVGNGGTSYAWTDEVNDLKVGPRAAGSRPGPACYGRGGTEPTVTDAYVVTGILNTKWLLGGKLPINQALAKRSVEELGRKLGTSVEETAEGIIMLANENAVNVIRLVSVQRGEDPRDYVLIAYGGSGPMFAPFIAKELEIGKVLVPFIPPGVFSAWGMIVSPLRRDMIVTHSIRLSKEGAMDEAESIFRGLEEKLIREFSFPEALLVRSVDARYYGQEHTVTVPAPKDMTGQGIEELIKAFHSSHERTYGFKMEGDIEIVNFRVTGLVRMKTKLPKLENREVKMKQEFRKVSLRGEEDEWPVIQRSSLGIGAKLRGPVIVEDPSATILALKGQTLTVDDLGNLVIEQ